VSALQPKGNTSDVTDAVRTVETKISNYFNFEAVEISSVTYPGI